MQTQVQNFPIMEHFYTVQGEGMHAGSAAYFVRIGGCNIGCTWCDVKESWDATKHPNLSITQILNYIKPTKAKLVVITGGEPAMYDLTDLCNALIKAKYKVHIETSAAYPITGNLDWICVSPKKFKEPLPSELLKANELKVIVYNSHDLVWAKTFEKQVTKNCVLLLQPEWSVQQKVQPLIVKFVLNNPQWRISLQTHKYLNIP